MYLFDLDGTLLDSNGIWLDIDVAFLGGVGVDPVPEDYTDFATHNSFPETAVYTKERFGLPHTPEEIMDIWREMALVAYRDTLPLKYGARELLETLVARGERIALLTSCMPELCHAVLKRHRIESYFEQIFIAVELGMEKRNPDTYIHVASLCNMATEDCIFFDDAPDYCTAAKTAGMYVVGVADALFLHREKEMRGICDIYLETWEDCVKTFLKFPKRGGKIEGIRV